MGRPAIRGWWNKVTVHANSLLKEISGQGNGRILKILNQILSVKLKLDEVRQTPQFTTPVRISVTFFDKMCCGLDMVPPFFK